MLRVPGSIPNTTKRKQGSLTFQHPFTHMEKISGSPSLQSSLDEQHERVLRRHIQPRLNCDS